MSVRAGQPGSRPPFQIERNGHSLRPVPKICARTPNSPMQWLPFTPTKSRPGTRSSQARESWGQPEPPRVLLQLPLPRFALHQLIQCPACPDEALCLRQGPRKHPPPPHRGQNASDVVLSATGGQMGSALIGLAAAVVGVTGTLVASACSCRGDGSAQPPPARLFRLNATEQALRQDGNPYRWAGLTWGFRPSPGSWTVTVGR